MACVHEFGIIECIEEHKQYTYEPEKYKLVSVDDDFLNEIYPKGFGAKMQQLDTFVNDTDTPYKDLGYYGITLIPPSSLGQFHKIIVSENQIYHSKELKALSDLIEVAMKENKWLIHYGV